MPKRWTAKPWVLWTATGAWMILIFWFSSQTAEQSAALSEAVKRLVLSLFPQELFEQGEELPGGVPVEDFLRKAAHFFNFTVLGMLSAAAVDSVTRLRAVRRWVPAGICLVYAATDEIHQMFVPGRGPAVTDVLLDFVGSLCGILLLFAIRRAVRQRRQRRRN